MTSEKKICDSCNAIADSDAKFCRECGTALPPNPTNSSALLAQAKIALARADYKGVLRACAAAKLLDPNNAEVSQIMAVAHAALDVIRDQKPGERNAAHVQDSNPHRNKSNTRKRLHWGRGVVIAVVMIIVLGIINGLDDDETSSTSSSNNSSTNQQSDRTDSNQSAVTHKSKIAFSYVENHNKLPQIYVMDADGSNRTRLTNNSAKDENPSWSPDGTKIAFQSNRFSRSDQPVDLSNLPSSIYVMDADGSNQIRLTDRAGWDASPSWSPDGSKIAFESNRGDSNNSRIFVMNSDGSNHINLTDGMEPSWSPDGSKIAFNWYVNVGGNKERSDIFVIDVDGSNQINLTTNSYSDWSPSWSPDGSKIAFEAGVAGGRDIFVMDADGSNQINLTYTGSEGIPDASHAHSPSWSPDGSKIAFEVKHGFKEIYVMDADGSNPTRLTNNGNWKDDRTPSWAPAR
jgi:Tol biopolymer transport system component